jgi:glycosyltransferase involved in cell wall biosynthesis
MSNSIKLLFSGWRNIHHSFSIINQNHILSILARKDFNLYYQSMPLLMPQWNKNNNDSGFSEFDNFKIANLPQINEADADCVYRICAPMFPPNNIAKRTLTFAITELGFTQNNLSNHNLTPIDFTQSNNLVVTSSRWSRDRLIDFGFSEDKVRIISCGVNTSTFNPISVEDYNLQRSSLVIPEDAFVFLNVGAATWNKGQDLLIQAFCHIHSKYPATRLILKDAKALYGLSIDSVFSQISQKHPSLLTGNTLAAISVLSNSISQLQLRNLYGLADCYVSPYRAEGFNLPVLEAQACGIPVIVSSGGATDDFCNVVGVNKIASVFLRGTLGNEKDCAWVEPNLECLISLMEQAVLNGPRGLQKPTFTQKMLTQNASNFTWDKATDKLLVLMKP